jgi:hypothetical protein
MAINPLADNPSARLLAVEEPCEEEHERNHEGQLGMGQRAVMELHDSIPDPGRTPDEPDPRRFSHR